MSVKLTHCTDKLARGESLTESESSAAFAEIFEKQPPDGSVRAFLTALHKKGESVSEVVGAVRYLRAQGVPVQTQIRDLIDCCGTGGDQKNTFNISTAVAFVLAGAGCSVAKHGNRAITSASGSADVLSALGVKLDLSPAQQVRCLESAGIAFFFAPNHYPMLKAVAHVRKSLPHRTIFNLLGPLLNPAGAKRQLIGLFDAAWCKPVCEILKSLGSESVVAVHSQDGYDEFSLTGLNQYARLQNGKIEEGVFDPRETGYAYCKPSDLVGGSAQENAERLKKTLKGHSEPLDHMVHVNAAWGLIVAGKAQNIMDGLLMAQESVSSGKAYAKLEALIEFTNAAGAV